MLVPDDLRYAETHEWIRPEGGIATIGITDHAQAELTDIVYVELPQVGTALEAKQAVAVVESVKAASDIYSPVSGEVVEVNAELESNPALVNTDPYTSGWLFKVKLSDPQEVASLKTAAEYSIQIGA
jgi:glycine cleavage system H protein